MSGKKFYLTTPIFYPNGSLHLGHAYTSVIADIISNYKKSKGYEVYFHTGSDDHGEKIEKTSSSLAIKPQKLVDQNVLLFQGLWKELGINYDIFYRTSFALHKKKVQKFFTKLLKQGDIYLDKYRGSYCVTCEDYIKDSLNNKAQTCPVCCSSTKILEEKAYFFKVSKYQQQLLNHYQNNPDFLIPTNAKKELFTNFLKDNVRDLCITRSDISWGIQVPNEPQMIIYVWFDALCNYLTSEIGEKMFDDDNTEIIHLVGKEISRFHAIYWPTILLSLKKRLPNKIIAHGWLINSQGKMSKSKGNVIDPLQLLKKYPKDLLRLYFIAKVNFLQDGIFSEELLKNLYRDFYINNLGNLCFRTCKMLELYNNSVIPKFKTSENIELNEYYQNCLLTIKEYQKKFDNYQLTQAYQEIIHLLDSSNKLIQKIEPWNLFKEKKQELLKLTLNYLINGIRIIAYLLFPIAPSTSQVVFANFGWNYEDCNWVSISDFGNLSGKKISKIEKHLFTPLPA